VNEDVQEVAHGSLRGAIGALAMSGFRTFTVDLGLLKQTPPEAIAKQRAHGILRMVPRKRRRVAIEAMHVGYGAVGGAMFGLLPDRVRRTPGAGPVYGMVLWLGFELGIAPVLGLSQSKKPRPVERAATAADHLLYGLLMSDMRRRPQD
jgi:hypothetical protein